MQHFGTHHLKNILEALNGRLNLRQLSLRLQNNYDTTGFSKDQVRLDLKTMKYKAYRDGTCQALTAEHKRKRVECALKNSRLLLKWEMAYGLEMKFQLLWHSDQGSNI